MTTAPGSNETNTNDVPNPSPSYLETNIPDVVVKKLQAGAFERLCIHLQERSDEVQNIDLMTVSGFCRNCLAKWIVVEARKLSDEIQRNELQNEMKDLMASNSSSDILRLKQALDALGYDEAAQHVYGMTYPNWKKRHLKKATDEKMKLYTDSSPIWAQHDKKLLEKRSNDPPPPLSTEKTPKMSQKPVPTSGSSTTNSLLSNVCCQDIDEVAFTASSAPQQRPSSSFTSTSATATTSSCRTVPKFVPPLIPSRDRLKSFTLGILTVSDRASQGQYVTGDLSGPAVRDAVLDVIGNTGTTNVAPLMLDPTTNIHMKIVPDDVNAIQDQLKDWSDDNGVVDLVFTTGGTGFSKRDVTPEATTGIVDHVCEGLLTFCTMECASLQPLASLSRGTAGIRNKTLIVNLPGNPKGVGEIIPSLLPLCLHAVADLKHS